jgi:hypothetical protein
VQMRIPSNATMNSRSGIQGLRCSPMRRQVSVPKGGE